MPKREIRNSEGLLSRVRALAARKSQLEAEIEAENSRPQPDGTRLQRFKRFKLRIKDEITSIEGVLRAVNRGNRQGHI